MLSLEPRAIPVDPEWTGLEALSMDLRRFLAQRCRDESEIDDVVQETLLRAARYRDRLTEPEKLLPWARRIAANVLCDRFRRECRVDRAGLADGMLDGFAAPELDHVDEDDGGEVRCGSWVLDKDAALELLAGELVELRPEDRRLLTTFYSGAQSCREAAATCEVPLALVKVRLFRARKRLLKAMRRRLAMCAPRGCRLES